MCGNKQHRPGQFWQSVCSIDHYLQLYNITVKITGVFSTPYAFDTLLKIQQLQLKYTKLLRKHTKLRHITLARTCIHTRTLLKLTVKQIAKNEISPQMVTLP
jgi:hypothetical protein